MDTRYDQETRLRVDTLLQRRAMIGGNGLKLLVLIGAWTVGSGAAATLIVGASVAATAILAARTRGMTDRSLANTGFFWINLLHTVGMIGVCHGKPFALTLLPMDVLIYTSFGDGERDVGIYVALKVLIAGGAALAVGAQLSVVATSAGLAACAFWFTEGRGLVLGTALAELHRNAKALLSINDELQALYCQVAAQKEELKANYDALHATQECLVQSQKMAAIGQLAAGLAHEINNPLAVILGFAEGIGRRIGDQDALRLPIDSITREALRCRTLVQELLTFSRAGKRRTGTVDINDVVRASAVLLEARANGQGVRIVQDLAAVPALAHASGTQLQQVVLNLGNNALDSMPHGGVLQLCTSQLDSGRVVLQVADTGEGIAAEVLPHIFEPFFTTKEVGKGTGLGLSLVYEIVQQHRGLVEVHSRVGEASGTTMLVSLPFECGNIAHGHEERSRAHDSANSSDR